MAENHEPDHVSHLGDHCSDGPRSRIDGFKGLAVDPNVHGKQETSPFVRQQSTLNTDAMLSTPHNALNDQQSPPKSTAQAIDTDGQSEHCFLRDASPLGNVHMLEMGQTMVDAHLEGDFAGIQTTMSSQPVLPTHQEAIPSLTFSAIDILNESFAKMGNHYAGWTKKLEDHQRTLNRQVESEDEVIEDLRRNLARNLFPTRDASQELQELASSVPRNEQRPGSLSYEFPISIPSPSQPISPLKLPPRAYTSEGLNLPPQLPNRFCSPPEPRQSPGSSSSRHRRTVSLEHLPANEDPHDKPDFIIADIEDQDDRSLLPRLLQQIEGWTESYILELRTLDAEEIEDLADHPIIARTFGRSAPLAILVTEQASLNTLVASIIYRHMCTYALDEHFLQASGHPQASLCEDVISRWSRLPADTHEAKHSLFLSQHEIYTTIQNEPGFPYWRATRASHLSTALLSSLSGLLTIQTNWKGLSARNMALEDLYVKGYEIGFRLRMARSRWSLQWPLMGAAFEPTTMVCRDRVLCGDVTSTMTGVSEALEVCLAVSPMVTVTEFEGGAEKSGVVHHAVVYITRRSWT